MLNMPKSASVMYHNYLENLGGPGKDLGGPVPPWPLPRTATGFIDIREHQYPNHCNAFVTFSWLLRTFNFCLITMIRQQYARPATTTSHILWHILWMLP